MTYPTDKMDSMQGLRLRPCFWRTPNSALAFAVVLASFFAAMRAIAMLGPIVYRPFFLLHCVFMACVPWVFLSRADRQQVGLKRSAYLGAYPQAALAGVLVSSLCFLLGYLLFGMSSDNWFVSIGNSFRAQPTDGFSLLQLHLMFTIPGCIFSPIGEEIFFRGFFQRSLETRLSEKNGAFVESAWFAAVHLIHHGIVATAIGFAFRPLSGALWFLLMFVLSCLFAWLRKRSDSIFPAIVAHSAFNATMNSFIFAYLWY